MKLRNLAFFGVMASILGVNGAYAADTATVIASQAYVDAQNALDEKVAHKETVDYSAVTDKNSTTKYPSMKTLTTAIDSVDLSDELAGLTLSAQTGNGVIKTVTQTNGQVAATRELIGTNDIDGSAVTMPKTDFVVKQGSYQNGWEAASESGQTDDEKALAKAANETLNKDKYVPTVSAVEARVKDAIAEAKAAIPSIGDATVDADSGKLVTGVTTTAGEVTAVSSSKVTNDYIDDDSISGGKLTDGTVAKDKLATTVQTSLGLADTALQPAVIVTGASGGLGSTSSTTTAPSEKAVADELAKKADSDDVYSQDEADEKFEVLTNKAGTSTLTDKASWATIASNNRANDLYPTVKAVEERVKAAEGAVDTAIEGLDNTDTSTGQAVVKVDTANGIATPTRAALAYDKAMDNALKDVNNKSANQTCDKDNPCVLTYLGNQADGVPTFRWTQMDPDGLDADI